MGPEVLGALVSGGAVTKMIGANRMRDKQRSIMNRQMARTNQTMDSTTGDILGEGKRYDPASRMQDMQAQEDASFGQAQQDLQGAGAGIIPTAGDAGAVSSDFLKAKADRALSEGNRMTAIARELAKVRAPGQQMTQEGIRRAGVQEGVASRWGTTRNMGQAAQMQADAVEEPWWSQIAGLAKNVGMAGAMRGF